MNLLDVLLLVLIASAALAGYRLGFLTRAASWAGLALGLVLAIRFLPGAVRDFDGSSALGRLLLAALMLVGGALAGQGLGLIIGARLRGILPPGPLRTIDRGAGCVAGALGVLVALWLLLPAMADSPPSISREVRNSVIARGVDRLFPRPPNALQTLRRLVGDTRFPSVFDVLRPTPAIGPPPADSGLAPAVIARVRASTVKVQGPACGRIQEGSGFAVAADTIVTNAHVVAGEHRTTVIRPDQRRLPASVVLFDSDRDLALLHVTGLAESPLELGPGSTSTRGAVFGHPEGLDEVVVSPAAVRQEVDAVGRDLYDSHQTHRDVFILAAALHPGDSGGALVSTGGIVVGVAFAIAPDRPDTAYALTGRELDADLAYPRGGTVSTGPCLSS